MKTAQGIPRRLNILCDNVLIAGFRLRQPTISRATVTRVIAEREGIQSGIWWNNRMALTAAAAVLLTISVLIFALWNPPRNAASVTASESEPTAMAPGSPSAQPTPPEEVPLKPMAPVSAAPEPSAVSSDRTTGHGRRNRRALRCGKGRSKRNRSALSGTFGFGTSRPRESATDH